MDFHFANLLGSSYRGGSLVFNGDELLSPVGNRVSLIDLAQSTTKALPFENQKQVRTVAVSPDGRLLLSVDADGRALLANKARGALLHRMTFKGAVAAAKFSPDGRYVAVAVSRLLQVWLTPGVHKVLAPWQLHRTYGHSHGDVTALDWSEDGRFLAAASKDVACRIFTLDPVPGFTPPTLAGHKDVPVAVFFLGQALQSAAQVTTGQAVQLVTVSRDGALFMWAAKAVQPAKAERLEALAAGGVMAGGQWSVAAKHFFMQRGGTAVSCADVHAITGVSAVGYSSGVMDVYQLPEFTHLHTLSVSTESLSALRFNPRGDWLAVGSARLGQLLVWDWRAETYVLRQQGHAADVAAAVFSPDGAVIATGGDDAKIKLYQVASGLSYATLTGHAAGVTALAFAPSGGALLSAAADGTVRAHDTLRYRTFRTMAAPRPVQFASLALDPGGEVVVAGTSDSFEIYVWALKTGRLLDVLAGHAGPVAGLAFSPSQPLLASASWDRSVRLWGVFGGGGGEEREALVHSHDVLALAFRPDGRQLASATLDGQIYFWDPLEGTTQGTIEGRRDLRGGRLAGDRRAAGNLSSGACFTSLTYSADGAQLLAGGDSKYVCLYHVGERVLLRRFQLSANLSLDGVLDVLNSAKMTDAGSLDALPGGADYDIDDEDAELYPATVDPASKWDVPGAPKKRPAIRARCVCLSPTGSDWAAATPEGLVLYSQRPAALFDPTDLGEHLTPAAARAAVKAGALLRAALIALRLNDELLLCHVMLSVPPQQVRVVAEGIPRPLALQALRAVAALLSSSPHAEHSLSWASALATAHGATLQAAGGAAAASAAPVLRQLLTAVDRLHADMAPMCEDNLYLLDFLTQEGGAAMPNGGGGGMLA